MTEFIAPLPAHATDSSLLVGTHAVYDIFATGFAEMSGGVDSNGIATKAAQPSIRAVSVDSVVTAVQGDLVTIHSIVAGDGGAWSADYSAPLAFVVRGTPPSTAASSGADFVTAKSTGAGTLVESGATDGRFFAAVSTTLSESPQPSSSLKEILLSGATGYAPAPGTALWLLPNLASPTDGVSSANVQSAPTAQLPCSQTDKPKQEALDCLNWAEQAALGQSSTSGSVTVACTTGGDSTLQTRDNLTIKLKTTHSKLSLCGDRNTADGSFRAFYTEEYGQADSINWFCNGVQVSFAYAYTDHAHSDGQQDFIGIFPLVFDQVFYEHDDHGMTVYYDTHSTYLHGHIDTYNTLHQQRRTFEDSTFYTEPNSWPNNSTGPNAEWYILS